MLELNIMTPAVSALIVLVPHVTDTSKCRHLAALAASLTAGCIACTESFWLVSIQAGMLQQVFLRT